MPARENQIVVYQPNETVRLDNGTFLTMVAMPPDS